MYTLDFINKTVRTEMTIYKSPLVYGGTKTLESKDPASFELPEDTTNFVLRDIETITTTDDKVYEGGDQIGVHVYMGFAMPIEDAVEEYPEKARLFALGAEKGATRVAVRADGFPSIMYYNGITFDEYCAQYKNSLGSSTL